VVVTTQPIAVVGKAEGLEDLGVHSKRVQAIVLPYKCLQARGLDPTVERLFLQRGAAAADTRSNMRPRPDMMIVETTKAEQQQRLRHDDNSGSKLTSLTPVMPTGNPKNMKIEEGGYCLDTRYQGSLQEKKAQHEAMEGALKDDGYYVTTLPTIIGQFGSQCHATCYAIAKIGIKHGPASTVMSKLHEHAALTFHKILTPCGVLKREKTDNTRQNRPNPLESTLGLGFSFPFGLWPMIKCIAPGFCLRRLLL